MRPPNQMAIQSIARLDLFDEPAHSTCFLGAYAGILKRAVLDEILADEEVAGAAVAQAGAGIDQAFLAQPFDREADGAGGQASAVAQIGVRERSFLADGTEDAPGGPGQATEAVVIDVHGLRREVEELVLAHRRGDSRRP